MLSICFKKISDDTPVLYLLFSRNCEDSENWYELHEDVIKDKEYSKIMIFEGANSPKSGAEKGRYPSVRDSFAGTRISPSLFTALQRDPGTDKYGTVAKWNAAAVHSRVIGTT